MKRNTAQQGFTLIELMIVVAIIGILSAILVTFYMDYTAKTETAESFVTLDGLKSTIAGAMSEDPAVANCGLTAVPAAGKYSSMAALPTVAGGVCTVTVTMNNVGVNANVQGKTVIMTYNAATGVFQTSQAITGGTIGGAATSKYLPVVWR